MIRFFLSLNSIFRMKTVIMICYEFWQNNFLNSLCFLQITNSSVEMFLVTGSYEFKLFSSVRENDFHSSLFEKNLGHEILVLIQNLDLEFLTSFLTDWEPLMRKYSKNSFKIIWGSDPKTQFSSNPHFSQKTKFGQENLLWFIR